MFDQIKLINTKHEWSDSYKYELFIERTINNIIIAGRSLQKKIEENKMHHIRIGDIVSSETTVNGVSLKNRLFTVTGIERLGELDEFGGMYNLRDFKTGENISCPGDHITVWKPASRGKREPQ